MMEAQLANSTGEANLNVLSFGPNSNLCNKCIKPYFFKNGKNDRRAVDECGNPTSEKHFVR
jgi:hypothetical protein